MRLTQSTNPNDVDLQETEAKQMIFETLSLQMIAQGLVP